MTKAETPKRPTRRAPAQGAARAARAEPTSVAYLKTQLDAAQQQIREATEREASIGLENVRLFNEAKESLEQQTAIADVLKTIGRAAFDLEPVLEIVVENASRLAHADIAWLSRVEGDRFKTLAYSGGVPATLRAEFEADRERESPGGWLPTGTRSSLMGRVATERKTIHVADVTTDAGLKDARVIRATKARTVLGVPMIREGQVIGGMVLARYEVRPFSEREVELVQTFTDQAAIAIENVRLFNEAMEALEQQTATSEVLKVISRSTTDLTPALQALTDAAVRLLGADSAVIFKAADGKLISVAATNAATKNSRPADIVDLADSSRVAPRAFLTRSTVVSSDISSDPAYAGLNIQPPLSRLAVPIVTGAGAFGVMSVGYMAARPFTQRQVKLIETFADQAAIAIENARLFNETSEALEQQTATAEVLRSISGSPTDVQPVLDAIAANAVRYCGAEDALVFLLSAGVLDPKAHAGPVIGDPAPEGLPLDRDSVTGHAFLDRRTVQVADQQDDAAHPLGQQIAARTGHRTVLGTPLLRQGEPVGAIVLRRTIVQPFTPEQVQLVEAFASQAVIAIENVRLFNETKEALERQTAISEILRSISASPTDVRPVLDAIVLSALRFCAAEDAGIMLPAGDYLQLAAHRGTVPVADDLRYPNDGTSVSSRAFLESRTVSVDDLQTAKDFPMGATHARAVGYHAIVAAPLHRDGSAIGSIVLRRFDAKPFSDREIAALETFADQAVIAIENVRLFNETKDALERQTAISEILRAISASPTDVQPVLDAIAENARRFCAAEDATVNLVEGASMTVHAHDGPLPYPQGDWPADRTSVTGRSIVEGRSVHVVDLGEESLRAQFPLGAAHAQELGEGTNLATPLLRSGKAIGAILLRRLEKVPFTNRQVELLETFADQAVIAIENVRLFHETKQALEQQTATAEVLKTISRSAFDLQGVLDTVVGSAAQQCAAETCVLWRLQDDAYRMAAHWGSFPPGVLEELAARAQRVGESDTVATRAAASRRAVQVEGVLQEPNYTGANSTARTRLGVPLLRDGEPIGVLTLSRSEVRAFSEKEIELVTTFADQAVIAIENARLIGETMDALERQTAISEILRIISSSPTDVQPVLNTIAESAARYCGADDAGVALLRDDGTIVLTDTQGGRAQFPQPFAIVHRSVTPRAIKEARLFNIPDMEQLPDDEFGEGKAYARVHGYRGFLAAPLLKDGHAIGAIQLRRASPGAFSPAQVELIQTFAAQAVIALDNVRLFHETKEALARQTAVSEVLATISRSVFDLEAILTTVLQNAVRLCGAKGGLIVKRDGAVYRLAAVEGGAPEFQTYFRDRVFVPGRDAVTMRAVVEGRAVLIDDVLTDPDFKHTEMQRAEGFRSLLGVPLFQSGEPIGAMSLWRNEVRPFSAEEVGLVTTFADQAAIAIGNVNLFNEIRDQARQLEAVNADLEAANRHKSEFLANMSHELRTPLNAIIGFSDVLEQRMFGELNDQQSEYVRDISGSGRHLLDLVNEILDLAKVEAGRMELEPSEFAFEETIRGAIAFVRERAAQHRIELTTDVAPDTGTLVADERKIRQVLLNLLSNAVKFTPDGGRVGVSCRRTGGEIEVSVRDTGIGIAPADLPKVFEEFQQVGGPSERAHEGTGLGLTLAKGFIELHGGRIWVDSEVGHGSTFTFRIPAMASVTA